MVDFIFYANFFMLITNIIVFVLVMREHNKLRVVKVGLLIAISIGTLVNFGKLTWLSVLFAVTPFLLLGKIFGKVKESKEQVA